MHDVGDERREPVVVAEADLVRRDGVVLVDDRDDAQREQPFQGALGVAVVPAAVQVVGRQQHLADAQPEAGERDGVALGEQQLSHTGRRLLRREVAGAGGQPERSDARRDRAGGHQHHLLPGLDARGDRLDQIVEALRREPAA